MTAMRAVLATLLVLSAPAMADTFGGFSGVDKHYLVTPDKVCKPLEVVKGAAKGAPSCQKAGADVIAKLSIKEPLLQEGQKALFAASASGRTLTVTRLVSGDAGEAIVTWSALDPIGKVAGVYASQYGERVAVAYTTRRMGKEVTEVIAFDLGKPDTAAPPTTPTAPTTPAVTAPPEDPKVTKAVVAARKANKKKQLQTWQYVLTLDASHAEAQYRLAAAQLANKAADDALATIGKLAASDRADAVEWLVEARFDPAFAKLRSDPTFRDKVGLDRPARTTYERLMGFGGQWEQSGTACDKAEVRMTVTRDRVVRLRVKTKCEGMGYDMPFKGTWRIDGDNVVLTFPTRGKAVAAADEAPCKFERAGDEDALHCVLGRDLDFVVLPTRR